MAQSSTDVVVSREFPAPADRVFAAWLDPQNADRWLFATETGTMVRVAIDARVGGEYTIVERREGEDVAHTGRYLAIEPPRHLAFTLQVPKYSPQADTIDIAIEPLPGGCRLTLSHPTDPAWADSTRQGWIGILESLAQTLARGD